MDGDLARKRQAATAVQPSEGRPNDHIHNRISIKLERKKAGQEFTKGILKPEQNFLITGRTMKGANYVLFNLQPAGKLQPDVI